MLLRFWNSFIVEPCRRVDAESKAYLASPESRGVDWKTAVIMVTVAFCLTIQHYLVTCLDYVGLSQGFRFFGLSSVADSLTDTMTKSDNPQLAHLTYWVLGNLFIYVVIPVFVLKVIFRENLRDYGLKLRGALSGWPIYIVMLAIMGPLIWAVSYDAHFQATYPFYRLRPGEGLSPAFCRWEVLYFFQFLGLEFFFRGFIVHGTKHRFGMYSIFVMMVPYCMIHFQKPILETCGAIAAGIALGFMSLKTKSIWLGAALHMSVAISMDLASLHRKGLI